MYNLIRGPWNAQIINKVATLVGNEERIYTTLSLFTQGKLLSTY